MGEENAYRNGLLYGVGSAGQNGGHGLFERPSCQSGPTKWELVGKSTWSKSLVMAWGACWRAGLVFRGRGQGEEDELGPTGHLCDSLDGVMAFVSLRPPKLLPSPTFGQL